MLAGLNTLRLLATLKKKLHASVPGVADSKSLMQAEYLPLATKGERERIEVNCMLQHTGPASRSRCTAAAPAGARAATPGREHLFLITTFSFLYLKHPGGSKTGRENLPK